MHLLFLFVLFISTSTGQGQRSNLAPQSMQWAIRNRDPSSRSAGEYLTSIAQIGRFQSRNIKFLSLGKSF